LIIDNEREEIMSILNTETVLKIAHLARLNIDEQAAPKYVRELSNILDLVEQMNRVDTKQVEPMAHPLDVSQRLRADVISETNQRDLFQSIAPQVEAGLYLVPQVIE
jgi:aspartyl-tRNA(Asn)/glutamyl-tRNA(Gln) amidotransferase subunit C